MSSNNKFIDLGIDFGAENIIITAIGTDNLGRKDYKLISLDGLNVTKNYIGIKENNFLEIGKNPKLFLVNNNNSNEYKNLYGRYKKDIGFSEEINALLPLIFENIINKVENFDFSKLLSGELRNLCVGIPQNWQEIQKEVYLKALSKWKHGEVFLLSEPIAASISANSKLLSHINNNVVCFVDIGASTIDLSFVDYSDKTPFIYPQAFREIYSGHYFDLLFLYFAITADINKLSLNDIINIKERYKLKTIDDFLVELSSKKYSHLLLEIEIIKEDFINEIIKFGRKKLIDTGFKTPLTIDKKIYDTAFNYYIQRLADFINNSVSKLSFEGKNITLFLCGGGGLFFNIDKEIRSYLNFNFTDILSSKDYYFESKTDITISLGLASYASNKNIISKKSNFNFELELFDEDNNKPIYIEILKEGSLIPSKKSLYEVIEQTELKMFENGSEKIEFNFIKKNDYLNNSNTIVFKNNPKFEKGDYFDIVFQFEYSDIIKVELINLSKNITETICI